jgi:hypothetical protein
MARRVHRVIVVKWIFVIVCAACGAPVHLPPYRPQPTAALEAIPSRPPPARVEVVPPAPRSDAVWIDGEWTWRASRWSWIRGRWVLPPNGARYSPWVLVRAPNGSLYEAHGVWRDARGNPIAPPRPLASAEVSDDAIVDAEGNTMEPGRVLDARAPEEDAR